MKFASIPIPKDSVCEQFGFKKIGHTDSPFFFFLFSFLIGGWVGGFVALKLVRGGVTLIHFSFYSAEQLLTMVNLKGISSTMKDHSLCGL